MQRDAAHDVFGVSAYLLEDPRRGVLICTPYDLTRQVRVIEAANDDEARSDQWTAPSAMDRLWSHQPDHGLLHRMCDDLGGRLWKIAK